MKTLSSYKEMIQETTGAPEKVLSTLENIMRDEIFHSTLDWQTRKQFDSAARQAWQKYQADQAWYDAERDTHRTRWEAALAKGELEEAEKQNDPKALAKAKAAYEKAQAAEERAIDCLLSFS